MSKTISVHFAAASGATTTIEAKVGLTLMKAATKAGIDGIAADCGGQMNCATCHVYINEPFAALLPGPGSGELAMLTYTAVPRQASSRLSCQITLTGQLEGLIVSLPASQY